LKREAYQDISYILSRPLFCRQSSRDTIRTYCTSLVADNEYELVGNLILSHTYYPDNAAGLSLAGHERLPEFGSKGGLLSG
jgi:hypothetical protein